MTDRLKTFASWSTLVYHQRFLDNRLPNRQDFNYPMILTKDLAKLADNICEITGTMK